MMILSRYFHNQYSGMLTHFKYTDRDNMCIDIGTNDGFYALRFSKFFKCVHTYDPNPDLILNEIYNNDKIYYHNVGLSNKNEKNKDFYIVTDCPSFSGLDKEIILNMSHPYLNKETEIINTKVEIRTLDSYKFDCVDFIKIDTEGSEINILKGSIETISKHIPTIQIEIQSENEHEVNDILDNLGYICIDNDLEIMDSSEKKIRKIHTDAIFVHKSMYQLKLGIH